MPSPDFKPQQSSDPFASLKVPDIWPVNRRTADPLEIRFPNPSATQFEIFVEEFLGSFGEGNAKALFEAAKAGRSAIRTPLEFEGWRQQPWVVGERESFNNRVDLKASRDLDYTVSVPRYEDDEPRESWRGGESLDPVIAIRRTLPLEGRASLSMVASLGDPLPFNDRGTLAERWELIGAMFRSEKAQPLLPDLTEFVVAQDAKSATIDFGGATLVVAPYYRPGGYRGFESNEGSCIGADIDGAIHSEEHLKAVLRCAGVPLLHGSARELFDITRLNSGLTSLDRSRLVDLPVPLEITKYRENEFDGDERLWVSTTAIAGITQFGDLYLTLECDTESKGKLHGWLSWDSRTVRLDKHRWAELKDLLGFEK